jgi:type VI secretion system protein ImpA
VKTLVEKLAKEKRPAEEFAGAGEAGESDGAAANGGGGGVAVVAGAVRSRQEALKRLAEVAEFFRYTEPHSPVSYLVQRAVKWGQMPLEEWLAEVVKDGAALDHVRETLGIRQE